ncbi:AAA family ATPase [Mesorhizobium sp. M0915]|uniref:AAA family ATPase n=1 Tax=Mesorhizobium sp. M0915 TaxID=2957027 RepID=UPI003334ED7C
MFFFEHAGRRHTLPSSLRTEVLREPLGQIDRYLSLPPEERLQTDVPTVWKRPLEGDVLEALTTLSYGKCPFCEQQGQRLQPYRFRPPAYVEPTTGPGDKACYLWLTFNWENFFPICEACLGHNKSWFPVGRTRRADVPSPLVLETDASIKLSEKPQLLFPGEVKSPLRTFGVRLDGGLSGHGRRAEQTIRRFSLNRQDLVERRAKAMADELTQIARRELPNSVNGTIPFARAEFGGVLYLLHRRLLAELGRRQASIPRLPGIWLELFDRASFSGELDEARRRLQDGDEGLEAEASHKPSGQSTGASLTRVEIRNFKSLEFIDFKMPLGTAPATTNEYTDLPGAPCLLIIGENATGKSSILEAIALTATTDELRESLVSEAGRLRLDPVYMGGAGPPAPDASSVVLHFDDAQVALSISDDGLRAEGTATRPLVFAYGAHRLFGKRRRSGDLRHIDTLFENDRQLSNPEPWLIELERGRPDNLNEVVSALRHIIQIEGEFQNIEVAREGRTKRCYINIRKTRPDGSTYLLRQRLDAASSGYRAVLALVCDIFQGLMENAPVVSIDEGGSQRAEARAARLSDAIVLIDEIEAHLHPRWKLQIIAGLRAALPRVTFVITSHDPLCLRGMRKGEVMMLNRYQNLAAGENRTMPEVVERVADFDDIENFTIEQLLTSDLFRLYSTDDRRTDDTFARVAKVLAEQRDEADLNPAERADLARFRTEIAEALPYGRTEVTKLVQEAVADYLANRRSMDAESATLARTRAKAEIADFLWGILE